MNNRRILGVGTLVIALVLSIVSATVAFAAYNANLTINGSATMKGTHWRINFTDLKSAVTGNDREDATPTVEEKQAPSITGDTSIGTYKVDLKTPGDYIIYEFTINNSGDFAAVIDSSFAMPTPTCTKGPQGKDEDEANVCDNLEYTLSYVKANATPGEDLSVKAGDTLAVGESKVVQLKLHYKKDAATVSDSTLLPFDDVTIGNLNITIPFVQQ